MTTIYSPDCPTIRSRLLPFCRLIADKGYEFTFLLMEKENKEIYPGIRYKGYKNYLELIRMTLNIAKSETDIILACKSYSLTGFLSYLISKIKRTGYQLDVDDRTFPSEIVKWRRLPLYIQEWFFERLMMFLRPPTTVASKALADYWGEHAIYIPNSVDLNYFKKENRPSNIIREKYNFDGKVVMWPAVFFQEIDRYYAIEVFEAIAKKKQDIYLFILGSGEYLPRIKNTVQKKGLKNIIFTGEINFQDIPLYYASADAGFLPLRDNHYDACKGPIKLYEYMAMELPVIATPIGEPKDIIQKAKCGVLIPFRDVNKASDVIINLLNSKETMRSMGHNGRTYLEKFQSIEQQAAKFEAVLNSVSKNKAPEE